MNPNWIVGLLVALYAATRLYGINDPGKPWLTTTLRVVVFIVAVCVVFMLATGMWTVTPNLGGQP